MEEKRYRTIPGVAGADVAVADDIPVELEVRLIAAIKSYQAGVKSMDRLLKNYGESWRRQLEEVRKISRTH